MSWRHSPQPEPEVLPLRSGTREGAARRVLRRATVAAIASDHGSAGLSAQEIAVVDFAGKVAADASSVTEADIAGLRGHGLDDPEIFHLILAVGARCFPSTALSAAGAKPDPQYNESLDVALRQVLSFGG